MPVRLLQLCEPAPKSAILGFKVRFGTAFLRECCQDGQLSLVSPCRQVGVQETLAMKKCPDVAPLEALVSLLQDSERVMTESCVLS